MIRGVFPRLHGFYKEGAILVGKWTLGASGAITAQASQTHTNLSLVKQGAAGTYVLSVVGGCRSFQILDARYIGLTAPTTAADLRFVHVNTAIVPQTTGCGVVITDGVTNAIEDGTSGDQIHIAIYVDK